MSFFKISLLISELGDMSKDSITDMREEAKLYLLLNFIDPFLSKSGDNLEGLEIIVVYLLNLFKGETL